MIRNAVWNLKLAYEKNEDIYIESIVRKLKHDEWL